MYNPVPKIPNFPELERKILQFWQDRQIFKKLREQTADGEPWSFLDGPITANNPMGVHHAWGRTLKDIYQRYHAMNGRALRYQNGFDCQGLWVEVEVEKSLGMQTKRDIAAYGIDGFVKACKERVLTFAARQTEQSIRLGYWCDWDDPATLLQLRDGLANADEVVDVTLASGVTAHGRASEIIRNLGSREYGGSYFTFSDDNNYTIWSFLKKCHSEGHLYRGHDVMPWCGRCGTGLSQMEVAEGRRITVHTSVYVRFPLRGQERLALLVWTTTPWTLTSNAAVAVNPNMTYLKVRHNDWTYYVGKANFDHVRVMELQAEGKQENHKLPSLHTLLKGSGSTEILEEIPGSELLCLQYDGPFDELPAQIEVNDGGKHRVVIGWTEISGTEGTGLVHIAPGCGAEDGKLGKENHLPVLSPLDESSRFVKGFGPYTGKMAREVAEEIILSLKAKGLLVSREQYPHVYPHCWRCKEELVFRLVDEWFLRMDWRGRIQRLVPDIQWIPAEGEAREQDWLLNMGDWMISKKRFWGLALPIWVCNDCGKFTVVGSREELKTRAIEGWDQFEGNSPHRPFVDAVMLRCESCGGVSKRVEDVGNPWLDAGIVPFSTLGYGSDSAYWEKWFPADLVLESFPGQFRNWFYSMLAMSAMMEDKAPFKTLLGYALVRDARGEEMHKSKGNSIPFDVAAEVLGAEIMRYLYAEQKSSHNLNFPDMSGSAKGGRTLDGEARRKLLTFWNCYSFFVVYVAADGWKPSEVPFHPKQELDRWILSRMQQLIGSAHQAMTKFEHYRLMEAFQQFDDEFSNWYLRRSRRRFWQSDAEAYETLYRVLTTVIGVMAPVLPFFTEEIYQNLVRGVNPKAPESVHLTRYPQVDPGQIETELEKAVDAIIHVKNLALHLRSQSKMKIRQPLQTLYLRPRDEAEKRAMENLEYRSQILDEANLKQIVLIEDERTLVTVRLKPDMKKVGQRVGRHVGAVAQALANMDLAQVGEGVEIAIEDEVFQLTVDEIVVAYEGPSHLECGAEHGTFAALDLTITPELERERVARDFNRLVQDQRKALNLNISAHIIVRYAASSRLSEAILDFGSYLQTELLADELYASLDNGGGVKLLLDGEEVMVEIQELSATFV